MGFLDDILVGLNRGLEKKSRELSRDRSVDPEMRERFADKADELRYRREEHERRKQRG